MKKITKELKHKRLKETLKGLKTYLSQAIEDGKSITVSSSMPQPPAGFHFPQDWRPHEHEIKIIIK